MKTLIALALTLTLAGMAYADSIPVGDPNWDRAVDWRSGMPVVLTVGVDESVPYDFSGDPLYVPFTLDGSQAMVYLAVYSKDANPQYDGEPLGVGGIGNAMLRRAGLDTLISVTTGQAFSEGENAIAWDGKDFLGNAMPEDEYTFYLIALDNISNPTWVGPTVGGGVMWNNSTIDERFDPPVVWSPQSGSSAMVRSTIGPDYHANPEAFETFDMSWMPDRRGEVDQWEMSFTVVDPVEPNFLYIGNYRGDNTGYWKAIYDPDSGTVLPDEDWPAADGGWVVFPQRIADGGLKKDFHHPWLDDDGYVYMSHMDRVEPIAPGIMVVSRETGEMEDFIGLSAIYNTIVVDPDTGAESIKGSWAPWAMEMDDRGFYTTRPSSSAKESMGHFTPDGDIIWMNLNGDFYADHYTTEECDALGVNCRSNAQQFLNQLRVGKYHIAIGSGYNDPTQGMVLGPDGSGLFKMPPNKLPLSLTGQQWWQATDSQYSGFYHQTGGGLIHQPFDVRMGSIEVGEPTAVQAIASADLPGSYELGDAYPNPFNPDTHIDFAVPASGPVSVIVYNLAGQEVANLVDETLAAGFYKTAWDGRDYEGQSVASGVYLYTITAGDFTKSKRMTLLK